VFILPVNRENDGSSPTLLWTIVAVDSIILALTPGIFSANSPETAAFFAHWGFVPSQHRLVSAFTSMFIHAGLLHLAGNTFFLWMFGKRVENSAGKALFLLIFVASGLGGTALHYLFNFHSAIPCVGASGAISGIAGAFLVFFPSCRFDLCIYFLRWNLKTVETRTPAAVGAWILEQALLGIISQAFHSSGVAYWAHVGGFATGVLLALPIRSFVIYGSKGKQREELIRSARALSKTVT
jgi:membrane associated rhomboid family serine protease